jgi:iron-sulfur cluster repair protein YtfE (RIC family)
MGITAKLRDDHDALLHMVERFRYVLGQPAAPAGLDLVKFRHGFSKQLLGHLTREDWLLYPSLLQSSERRIAATAQSFIDEMGGLMQAYKSWSAKWPTEAARANWSGFAAETTALLDQLERRIERENCELYPLVEQGFSQAA